MVAKGVNLWDINIFTLLYADDLVLIADNESDLKLHVNSLGNFADRYKIEINPKKDQSRDFSREK